MTDNDSLKQIKLFVLEELSKIYSQTTINLWFKPMRVVGIEGTVVTVSFPQNKKSFIEQQYFEILSLKFKEVIGIDIELKIITDEEEALMKPDLAEKKETAYEIRFNENYRFDNFVVGKSNQLAHSASVAVAKHPAELNNPLYLYGPSGLGKTHLLFSIYNQLKADHPDPSYKIYYVTGEEFTNELIDALSLKRPMAFREKYRNADVLLVDDIQFISGKMSVQEEFFHTFDTLFKMNKQIIIASDRAPKEIDNLEDRLKSRFVMGLVADIQPPDFELRVAIFKRKAQEYDFELSNDILYFLAGAITTNIRQIEGALKKLKAHSFLYGEEIDIHVAKRVLAEFFASENSKENIIEKIFEYAEKRFGVKREVIKSTSRMADVIVARHFAIYVVRKTTNLSQKSIAKLFNKKDHTTIINSINFIEKKMQNEPAFEREVNSLIAELLGN